MLRQAFSSASRNVTCFAAFEFVLFVVLELIVGFISKEAPLDFAAREDALFSFIRASFSSAFLLSTSLSATSRPASSGSSPALLCFSEPTNDATHERVLACLAAFEPASGTSLPVFCTAPPEPLLTVDVVDFTAIEDVLRFFMLEDSIAFSIKLIEEERDLFAAFMAFSVKLADLLFASSSSSES